MSTKALAGYAKYDSYKDSGVDWLGDIPEDWQLLKVRNIFRLSNKFAEKNNSHELLSVYTDIGVKPRRELEARGNKASTTDGYLIVEKGDIVVNKLLAWMGAIGYSNYNGVTSPAYDILKPILPVSSMFYHFLFRTPRCVSELKRNSRGIMDMRLRLYFDKFGNVLVPYPSLEEQEKIISFLNNETAKIDQAIELKQQQIEKLNEYKQITIQNAVTKGLDANAKMKDSGVDWIGDIPKHWEVKKLKYIARLKSGDTFSSDDFLDEGYEVYGGNGFRGYTNTYTNEGEYILIGRQGALCGNVNYARGKFYATEHAIVVHPINELNLEWLGESIKHANFNRLSTSAAQPGISVQVVREVSFPYCSLEEQDEIGIFIKKVINNVEKALSNFAQQIDRLNDYKTILINQAVTGKIKVS